MASLKRDDNRIPVIAGVSSSDTVTPIAPYVNPLTGRLFVDSNSSGGVTTSIVRDGNKLTSGTNVAVQLIASSVPCTKVAIFAYTTNSDTVAVGTSTVVAESSSSGTKTGRGEQLLQGAATSVYVNDASLIWIASASNGDGVSFIAYL